MKGFNAGVVSVRGHHIVASALSPSATVVDLGAHTGEFSAWLAAEYGCTCYAVEASPLLYQKLTKQPNIRAYHYAITDKDGPVTLYLSENPEAHSIVLQKNADRKRSIIVNGITLESFLKDQCIHVIDLLKADIEGAEVALFNSTTDRLFKKINQMTVEFHDVPSGPCSNRDVEAIKCRLSNLGFRQVKFARNNGDVLFLNKRNCPLLYVQYLYVKFILKYLWGVSRLVRRRLNLGSRSSASLQSR